MNSASMRHYGAFIEGREQEPSGKQHFETEDPYTGKPWAMIARVRRG